MIKRLGVGDYLNRLGGGSTEFEVIGAWQPLESGKVVWSAYHSKVLS